MKTLGLLAALAALAASSSAGALPEGAILVPMIRDGNQTAYFAELDVGTPPQKIWLKVDTGSPTYSFIDPRNQVCARLGEPCSTYGTFDNRTSSTCAYEGPGFANALSNYGNGDFLNDTVAIGGVSTEHMYFGYVNRFGFPERAIAPIYSILGLSLNCGFAGPQCTWGGPYLLVELKNASKIDHMASSIYLGPDERDSAHSEMILGGYYDEAKVDGDLFTLDMVDPFSFAANQQTNSVNVTAMEVVVAGNQTKAGTYGDADVGVPVLMDTGVASWPVPADIASAIFAGLGGLLNGAFDPRSQWQDVDCKYRDPSNAKGHVTVRFGGAGQIDIPLHNLVTRFSDDHCATFVSARGNVPYLFGDPFLRGAYMIFDQENWTITMSKAKYTQEQKIVPFPEGGFKAKGK